MYFNRKKIFFNNNFRIIKKCSKFLMYGLHSMSINYRFMNLIKVSGYLLKDP
jgi:CMP-N-acetylneuraminic acid synthetase